MSELSEKDSVGLPTTLDQQLVELDLEVCQAMLDALPYCALLVDRDHRIVAANLAVQESLCMHSDDLCGQYCPKIVHGSETPYSGCPLEEAVDRGGAVETQLHDPDSGTWTLSAIYPTNLVSSAGQPIFLHTARDITAEKEADRKLSQSLEHHKALWRLLERLQTCRRPHHVFEQLIDLTLDLSWMDVATAASGFLFLDGELRLVSSRNLAPGLQDVCAKNSQPDCICRSVAESGRAAIVPSDKLIHHCMPADVRPHGHATLPLVFEGRTLGILNFYMSADSDLSRSQLAYLEAAVGVAATALAQQLSRREAVRAREEKLALERQILRRVLASQEDERKRVSRELHDDLGQVLSALLLEIRAADTSDADGFTTFKRGMESSIRSIIDRVAQLAWELRPTILDDYGLPSAIARFAQRMGDLADLDIDFQYLCSDDSDERLPSDVEVVLYRIVQESINNVVRHAKAQRVSVLLVRQSHQAIVLVEDDGQGFDVTRVLAEGPEQSIGLVGMRERASLLRGQVVFESGPGRGTTVKATVPLGDGG